MKFLLFFLFLFINFHLSYSFLFKRERGLGRLNDVFSLFFFLIFLEFFILMYLKSFNIFFSLLFPFIFSFIFNFKILPYKSFFNLLLKDFKIMKKLFRFKIKYQYYLSLLPLFLFIRVSLMPPLSWDALTYHLPKAALWAQKGCFTYIEAPGGWGFTQSYFAGGSILPSYIILFSKNHLFLKIGRASCRERV